VTKNEECISIICFKQKSILYLYSQLQKHLPMSDEEMINDKIMSENKGIWTEEQQNIRQLNNLIDYEGRSCKGCNWSGYEEGADFITCGHHYGNFRSDSYCSYWTDPGDKNLLSFKKRRKEEMKAKYGL